jgi:nucleotide-binding universal stress UspA family protein
MTRMHVRQCPRCELRFTSSSELDYHLSNDHHPRPSCAEDELGSAAQTPTSAQGSVSAKDLDAIKVDRRPVVVGLDRLDRADAALRWALDDARSRRAPLRIVHAFGGLMANGYMAVYGDLPMPDTSIRRAGSDDLLAAAVRTAAEAAPELDISATSIDADAVSGLLGLAGTASTIVLGSRRLGAIGSIVLGSVSAAVSAHATCPVVVVRAPSARAENPTGAVVVGVDGFGDGIPALEYAFGFASRHSARLHVVRCWHPELIPSIIGESEPQILGRAEARLTESLACWRRKYPDVQVDSSVIRDHPVAGLVAASAEQRLLIVGSRGRGALAGTLLGSTSQAVLRHAACSVAVVKPDSVA